MALEFHYVLNQNYFSHKNTGDEWKYFCMHAGLLQSCLTLCNPMDCSREGSSVHGVAQARIQEWVAISFSNTCAYLCEINDSSNTRNENEELGLFCYYKLFTPPLKCSILLFKSCLGLVANV